LLRCCSTAGLLRSPESSLTGSSVAITVASRS
jgi:hypothetical protein